MNIGITYKQINISDPYYKKMLRLRRERIWIPKKTMLSDTFEADEAKSTFFGAFYNTRRLIGCIMLMPDKINKWTLMQQLAVNDQYEGMGIGQKLIKTAEEYAHAHHMDEIVLFSDETTKTYFERVGYHTVGGWYSHSNGLRTIMMRKMKK